MTTESEARAIAFVRNMHGIAMKQTGPYETLRKDHVDVLLGMIERLAEELRIATEAVTIRQHIILPTNPPQVQPWMQVPQPPMQTWTVATSSTLRNLPDGEGDHQLREDDRVGEDE